MIVRELTIPGLPVAVHRAIQASGQQLHISNLPALAHSLLPTITSRLDANVQAQLKQSINAAVPKLVVKNAFAIVDNALGRTPDGFIKHPSDPTWLTAAVSALTVMSIAGLQATSFAGENKGELFVHLVPENTSATGRNAEQSTAFMTGHTDALPFPFPAEFDPANVSLPPPAPDFVVLAALRNPGDVPTTVSPLDVLRTHMADDPSFNTKVSDALFQRHFGFKSQSSWDMEYYLPSAPILMDDQRGTLIRFSIGGTQVLPGAPEEAVTAYHLLSEALKQNRQQVVLKPGDIMLINNRTSLHGRERVSYLPEGNSRWLLRTYGYYSSTPRRIISPYWTKAEPC